MVRISGKVTFVFRLTPKAYECWVDEGNPTYEASDRTSDRRYLMVSIGGSRESSGSLR